MAKIFHTPPPPQTMPNAAALINFNIKEKKCKLVYFFQIPYFFLFLISLKTLLCIG